MYVDDTLLINNDLGLSYEIKKFLTKNFKTIDMIETTYLINIKIFKDTSQ